MSTVATPLFAFDNTFARELIGLYEPWQAARSPAPVLLALNHDLAVELGVDDEGLRSAHGLQVLAGNVIPTGATPLAQAYAGHQFGGYSPRLGDGRALLYGEVIDTHGHRRDIHLKGSGRTPFARGGDGRAAVGPMLREYLIGEAMHALGVPTTRGLAVVATGEQIQRDTMLPGAVLTRVAASHLRVGMFQYAAASNDTTLVRRLADYAIARHHRAAAEAPNPYLALFEQVLDVQAQLTAAWMLVGFIHGVMNTDNVTISGETIDYGPCAFMDAYDPATVFSSIDHGGRYGFGNQPRIAQWNLARLAEALLPLLADDAEDGVALAGDVLQSFPHRYGTAWRTGMRAKLGLRSMQPDDDDLVDGFLALLHEHHMDYTSSYRALATVLRGDRREFAALAAADDPAIDVWLERWRVRLDADGMNPSDTAAHMDAVNPRYIPRNHLVDAALTAASDGDLAPFTTLLDVIADPFTARPGLDGYAQPAPAEFAKQFRTFCGT